MTNLRNFVFAGVAASLFAPPVFAHHGSFAAFDADKTITLTGTVEKFEWTNPHMWLYVLVPQASGQAIEYPLVMSGTTGAVRLGWKPHIMQPGDKVRIAMHPLKDGQRGGLLLNVVLPSGRKLDATRVPAPGN